jgi:hypothetical protein
MREMLRTFTPTIAQSSLASSPTIKLRLPFELPMPVWEGVVLLPPLHAASINTATDINAH